MRTAVEVNFYGVLTGCRLVLPEMVRRRAGHIVNIASMAGMLAVPGQALYAGTKFAVVGLTTALADEYAPQGVQISCVMPSFTNTELIAGTNATGATKPVQPEDIAAAVVKTLDRPKTAVSVPSWSRAVAGAAALLPTKGRRWLSKQMGTDRVFLDFDTTAPRRLRAACPDGHRRAGDPGQGVTASGFPDVQSRREAALSTVSGSFTGWVARSNSVGGST